jgi:hypothetical protein
MRASSSASSCASLVRLAAAEAVSVAASARSAAMAARASAPLSLRFCTTSSTTAACGAISDRGCVDGDGTRRRRRGHGAHPLADGPQALPVSRQLRLVVRAQRLP